MGLLNDLRDSETRLSSGDLDHYRQGCRADAIFVMPGMTMTRDEAIAGLQEADPWDGFELSNARLRELGPDAAAIVYRFTGTRGDSTYTAEMLSTYVQTDSTWLLVTHQQTPV